jgi:hypothetical protein
MACAVLILPACGTDNPANAGTTAPGDKGHAFVNFPWKGQEVNLGIKIDYGEGDILGWLTPADLTDNPDFSVSEILKDNPAATMRLPLLYEEESLSFIFEESSASLQIVSLEAYPLDEDGNLLFSYGKDHSVAYHGDRNLSFSAMPCMDWMLSSVYDPDAVYRPQGYILHCKVNGWDKVYVFRLGVLIPKTAQPDELDRMMPQSPGDAWDFSPFVLVEAHGADRPMGGGTYLMTDAEKQELLELLKPETWSVVENPEGRGMEGAPSVRTFGGTALVMDDYNQDGSVAIALSNWHSGERFYYTAPNEVMDAFRAFTSRIGDKVFPELLR